MLQRTQHTWTAIAAYTGDWNEKLNSSYWCVWRRPLHVSAGRTHREIQAKVFRVKLGQGTFAWSAVTSKITTITACARNTGISAVVASCIQASQPGFAECCWAQGVQCCPFAWSAVTSKITTIVACARNTGIYAVVISHVGSTALGPLQCLVAEDENKMQNWNYCWGMSIFYLPMALTERRPLHADASFPVNLTNSSIYSLQMHRGSL